MDPLDAFPTELHYLLDVIRMANAHDRTRNWVEVLAATIRQQTNGLPRSEVFQTVFAHRDRLWTWYNGQTKEVRAQLDGIPWVVGEMSSTEPEFVDAP